MCFERNASPGAQVTRNNTDEVCNMGKSLDCIFLPFSEAGARSIKLRHFSPLKEKGYFRRQKGTGFALPPLPDIVSATTSTSLFFSPRAAIYWCLYPGPKPSGSQCWTLPWGFQSPHWEYATQPVKNSFPLDA